MLTFDALRTRGIYATLQTLPSGYRCTLQTGTVSVWGAGATPEAALAAAMRELQP